MLDEDAIADLAGDAEMLLRLARLPDDEPCDVLALCRHMTGRKPWFSRMGGRSRLSRAPDGGRIVCVRAGMIPGRTRFLICHELAELHLERLDYQGEDIEARCDALGAALAAPPRAVRAAIRQHAHKVHRLAVALQTTQASALLRIGEVDRRPVMLVRSPPIVRGALFEWPERGRAAGVHPVRLTDEPGWGMMAA